MTNCQNINPLSRSGTSQQQRQRRALDNDYVQVDERTTADLLIFARRLANQLRFYDLENKLNGDWSGFFSNDVAFLIAILANNEVDGFKAKWNELVKELDKELDGLFDQVDGDDKLPTTVIDNLPSFIPSYKRLHDFIWSLASLLNGQMNKLPAETGLKDFTQATVRKDCSPVFEKLLGLYKAALTEGTRNYILIDPNDRKTFGTVADLRQRFTQDILSNGLSKDWLVTNNDWQDYFENEIDDKDYFSAFGQNVPDEIELPAQVSQRLLPSLLPLESIFDTLINVFEKLAAEAPKYLEESLENWPHYQPHIALYLAFVKLFRFAQNNINGLKERHLDYYFKEVLRLKEKPPQPDEAHLLFTLAKHVEDHLLKEETAFKAGKDSGKKEVQYEAVNNTELNKAEVVYLRSVYHDGENGKYYASPIANSEDGQGEELFNENGQWKPFGPVTRFLDKDEILQKSEEGKAVQELFDMVTIPSYIGFAIASPNLFLREGTRTVTLEFELKKIPDGFIGKTWSSSLFKLFFSGEKGWLEANHEDLEISGNKFFIKCQLTADDPAIVPYDSEVHTGTYKANLPMVEVKITSPLHPTDKSLDLRDLQITGVRTVVDVEGVKDLVLENEIGRLDPAKPFHPFGVIPRIGSIINIGSNEVFQKNLKDGKLEINVVWDGLGDIGNIYKPASNIDVQIKSLNGGAESKLLIKKDLSPVVKFSIDKSNLKNYGRTGFQGFDFSNTPIYSATTKKGFIRLELENHFGHAGYHYKFAEAASQLAKEKPSLNLISDDQFKEGGIITLKERPYSPQFKSLFLEYKAISEIKLDMSDQKNFNDRQEHFFHLHPFGHREVHPFLNSEEMTLLPPIHHEGQLFIGLKNAQPRQTISVLFQVAEGSANPLKNRQPVEWHYLSENHWKTFDEADEASVADGTNDLLESGVVAFRLPRKINDDNRWLDDGFTWIRASVKDAHDAVCNLVVIKAQAAKVRFNDRGNAADFLIEPLAANTISKLVKSNSAIKKIEQPFSAFGNRPQELPEHFYRRISERLRHKERAITPWDFEHLVLEEFPEIYKVKCLNHTCLMPHAKDADKKIDNEMAPGHVLVVTLPDQKNRNATNPLLPFTSLGTLEKIKSFLTKKISPHVQLDVVNPRFEQVQLEFEVGYKKGFSAAVYDRILAADITQFLSPWAYETGFERSLDFGAGLHKSVVLDFVEEREYVDFVVQFKMHLYEPNETKPFQEDIEEAVATTGRSVLVSHQKHKINLNPIKC